MNKVDNFNTIAIMLIAQYDFWKFQFNFFYLRIDSTPQGKLQSKHEKIATMITIRLSSPPRGRKTQFHDQEEHNT
jgi:hypothetical protein